MKISISELLKKKNVNIIDIRNRSKYLVGHIPGVVSMDASSLLLHPENYLKKEEVYYFYCDFGIRSEALVEKLNARGYSTVSVIGGYNNYLLRR